MVVLRRLVKQLLRFALTLMRRCNARHARVTPEHKHALAFGYRKGFNLVSLTTWRLFYHGQYKIATRARS